MLIALAGVLPFGAHAEAQREAVDAGLPRSVAGVVMRGTSSGPRAVGDVRVVLHRVGPDVAGPLDSLLTDQRGRYAFRYRPSGSPDAVYFVSATYRGITYFTAPLRSAAVTGDDALITVFDTTSASVRLHVVGHHVVVSQPNANGRREVVEVFEVGNDSSVTLVSGASGRATWSAPLPAGAENPRVNPTGEVGPSNTRFADGRAQFLSPMSPGVHQLSYAYELPSRALPLSLTVEEPSEVLEVLVEEQGATVSGARMEEVAPVTTSGRAFRRFLGQGVPPGTVVRIDVPFTFGAARQRWLWIVATTCAAAMLAALLVALGRSRQRARAPTRAVAPPPRVLLSPSEQLLSEIAALDARFERNIGATEDERVRYESERGALKARLAAALADERRSE